MNVTYHLQRRFKQDTRKLSLATLPAAFVFVKLMRAKKPSIEYEDIAAALNQYYNSQDFIGETIRKFYGRHAKEGKLPVESSLTLKEKKVLKEMKENLES